MHIPSLCVGMMSNVDMIRVLYEPEDVIEEILAYIQDDPEKALEDAETMLRVVVSLKDLLSPTSGELLLRSLQEVVVELRDLVDTDIRSHLRGRPQIPISEDNLLCLLRAHFSSSAIASMLGVSTRTVRRIVQYGMEGEIAFSSISDTELDAITQHFVNDHPNAGERSFSGFLQSIGIKVQRDRVRQSMSSPEVWQIDSDRFSIAVGIMCACPIVCGISMDTADFSSV